MRVFLTLVAAAATVACSAAVPAMTASAATVRRVEVISLKPVPALISPAADAGEIEASAGAAGNSGRTLQFRVHDLDRRRIEYRMAEQFADSIAATRATQAASAGGDAGLGAIVSESLVPSTSTIAVPFWMRARTALGPIGLQTETRCGPAAYRPAGFLGSQAESRRARFYGLMSSIACDHGIPVGLFDALIIQESRYQAAISSPKSAFGLTQLMPGTAAELGVDRYAVEGNLRGGARYLRQQLDRFGHYHLALAAYNAGPRRVRNGRVPKIPETLDYVGNVLRYWARLGAVQRRAVRIESGGTAVGTSAVAGPPKRRGEVATF